MVDDTNANNLDSGNAVGSLPQSFQTPPPGPPLRRSLHLSAASASASNNPNPNLSATSLLQVKEASRPQMAPCVHSIFSGDVHVTCFWMLIAHSKVCSEHIFRMFLAPFQECLYYLLRGAHSTF
jgi:hypothetical protein